MNISKCEYEDCTYNETGLCVLENDTSDCPNLVVKDEIADGDTIEKPSVANDAETVALPSSDTLSLEGVRDLMREEHCFLVGLVGEPDTGKTACIVSLYLLLSQGGLRGYSFSDSRSLRALDELSRGARLWDGSMPDQMTSHTKLSDGRAAGFLHVKLRCDDSGERTNILIPDIPGEWTADLIDKNRTDRLGFLQSAEIFWLMIDGRALSDLYRTNHAIHRVEMLLGRLVAYLGPEMASVNVVISHYDAGKPPAEAEQRLREFGAAYGIELAITHIASFSRNGSTVAPGFGIAELVKATIGEPERPGGFWPLDEK